MTDVPDRVELFEADIAASPEALARLLDGWRQPDLGGRSRFAFTGLGSSRYAASVVATCLRSTGADAWVDIASTTTTTAPADDLVLVAISASGRTREVRDAAEHHRGRSFVVAVTNDPVSPLATMADLVVPLEAGEETGGIACRTFRATIVALALLTGLATPDGLRPGIDALTARLAAADGPEGWLAPMVDAHRCRSRDRRPRRRRAIRPCGAGCADAPRGATTHGPRLRHRRLAPHRRLPRVPTPSGLAVRGVGRRHRDHRHDPSARRRGRHDRTRRADAGPIERSIAESVVAERLAAALWRRATATG